MAIKHETFFPYAFDRYVLVLEIADLVLDGNSYKSYINTEERRVSIHSHDDWNEATLSFDVTVPQETAGATIPKEEVKQLPWSPIITVSCPATRKREVLHLEMHRSKEYNWKGEITLNRGDFHKKIDLQAFVVRSKEYKGSQRGFATKKGMRLASSERWDIYIDSPDFPPGTMLSIKWADFRQSKDTIIREEVGNPFYLDFRGQFPILWLNESIPDLKAVLMSSAARGEIATIRNSINDSIAQMVWCGLFNEALLSIEPENGENELPEPPEDWQKSILKRMAPRIFVGRNSDEAYEKLVKSSRDTETASYISSRSISSVLNFLSVTKNISSLMKMVEME